MRQLYADEVRVPVISYLIESDITSLHAGPRASCTVLAHNAARRDGLLRSRSRHGLSRWRALKHRSRGSRWKGPVPTRLQPLESRGIAGPVFSGARPRTTRVAGSTSWTPTRTQSYCSSQCSSLACPCSSPMLGAIRAQAADEVTASTSVTACLLSSLLSAAATASMSLVMAASS